MEKLLRTNELLAVELVKAWCSQHTTFDGIRPFSDLIKYYKTALRELDKMDAVEKDTESNELASSFNYSLSNDE